MPRKPNPAAKRMAVPMLKLVWTVIGTMTLGRMCRSRITASRVPTARAAST